MEERILEVSGRVFARADLRDVLCEGREEIKSVEETVEESRRYKTCLSLSVEERGLWKRRGGGSHRFLGLSGR